MRRDLFAVLPKTDPAVVVDAPHPVYDFGVPGEARISKEQARKELGLDPDRRIALFFGFIKPYKGVVHLIDAAPALRERYADWTVREDWFRPAAKNCYFMHCLPVRREVVVAGDVLEGPRSRVIPQARNRMFAQMAVLHRLLSRSNPK